VSGTTVTYVSGQKFHLRWTGQPITINGASFTIATVTDGATLTLTASAGTQSNVSYSVNPTNASTHTLGKPTGFIRVVNPLTEYDSGRGHVAQIAIVNWDDAASVAILASSLSSVLVSGDKYEIRKAENYSGAPLVSETWDGLDITVPTTDRTVAPRIGDDFISPSSFPRFAALILIRK